VESKSAEKHWETEIWEMEIMVRAGTEIKYRRLNTNLTVGTKIEESFPHSL
jgi:hypothetical protein